MKFKHLYPECNNAILITTDMCNLSCKYCFESNKSNNIMTPKTALGIIKKIYRDTGDPEYPFKVSFFGGEPLIGWDAMKTIYDYLNENNLPYKTGATSNLTLLTDEVVEYWKNADTFITASVDGNKITHDRNRSNSFDAVSKSLDKLNANNIPFEARMTISFDDMSNLFENVKFIHQRFNAKRIIPQLDTNILHILKYLDLEAQWYKIADYYLENLNTDTEFNFGGVLSRFLDLDLTKHDECTKCCYFGSNTSVVINWNGDVVSCPDSYFTETDWDMNYGNILEDNLNPELKYDCIKYQLEAKYARKCDFCRCKGNICNGECYLHMIADERTEFGQKNAFCQMNEIYYDVVKYIQNALK